MTDKPLFINRGGSAALRYSSNHVFERRAPPSPAENEHLFVDNNIQSITESNGDSIVFHEATGGTRSSSDMQAGSQSILQAVRNLDDEELDPAVAVFLSQGVRKNFVTYHWKIFLSQLFYQLMFPLSIPIAWWRLGRHALGTMSFLPATWRWNGYQAFVLCFQWGLPAFLFVSVGILGWFCREKGRCNDVSMATFALGLTCFVMHRIIIAVKYGYMSSRQYRRIMSSAGVKGLHKNKNEQLLTGWIAPDPAVIHSEFMELEKSLNLPLMEASFSLKAQAVKEHSAFLEQCRSPTTGLAANETMKFPLFHLMNLLMVSVTDGSRKTSQALLGRLPFVLSLSLGAIPILVHGHESGVWFGDTWYEVVFNVLSLILCMMYGAITLSFCYTGILDFRRRFLVYRALVNVVNHAGAFTGRSLFNEFLDSDTQSTEVDGLDSEEAAGQQPDSPLKLEIEGTIDVQLEEEKSFLTSKQGNSNLTDPRLQSPVSPSKVTPEITIAPKQFMSHRHFTAIRSSHVPFIELDCQENIATWLMARRVVKSMGLRYWHRVQTSLAFMALASLVLLSLQVADWMSSGFFPVGSGGRIAIVTFSISGLMILAAALALGAMNNMAPFVHVGLLNEQRGKLLLPLSRARRSGDAAEVRRLKNALLMIDFGIRSIELEALLEPVKILGIRASFMIFKTVCVVIFSGLGFLLKLVS